jgi:serine-type D-Ala-D-Ala carboxypeptidase (penicillin-binding protein 5/6)
VPRPLAVLALLLGFPASAAAALPPPTVPVAAFVVADGADGRILASQAGNEERPIASITKLMTAYLALRAGAYDRTFRVPVAATGIGESTAGLHAGERVAGRRLLELILIPSANDAAETLAVGVAGSEAAFVARMNQTAHRLGLLHTVYRSPYGLDRPGAHSTAADQLVLARLLMRDGRVRAIVHKRFADIDDKRLPASNTLLGVYPGLDGVKTGHTLGAGWCLAATAHRNGERIYVVALGAVDEPSRNGAVATLLDWGFRQIHPVTVVHAGDAAGSVPTSDGGTVPVVASGTVGVVLRPGERIAVRYELPSVLRLPVGAGATEGRLTVLRDGVPVGATQLVTAQPFAVPSVIDRVETVFRSLFA